MVGLLVNHGVAARASGDDAGCVDLALQSQGVRVLVDEVDRNVALEILGIEPDAPGHGRVLNRFESWFVRLLGGRSPEAR